MSPSTVTNPGSPPRCDASAPVSGQEFTDDEYGCTLPSNTIGTLMNEKRMFHAEGVGSDFPPELEPDDNTFVCSPHKGLSGFWSNDIDTQLRQRGIDTLVLAGMGANLRVESTSEMPSRTDTR